MISILINTFSMPNLRLFFYIKSLKIIFFKNENPYFTNIRTFLSLNAAAFVSILSCPSLSLRALDWVVLEMNWSILGCRISLLDAWDDKVKLVQSFIIFNMESITHARVKLRELRKVIEFDTFLGFRWETFEIKDTELQFWLESEELLLVRFKILSLIDCEISLCLINWSDMLNANYWIFIFEALDFLTIAISKIKKQNTWFLGCDYQSCVIDSNHGERLLHIVKSPNFMKLILFAVDKNDFVLSVISNGN